MKVTLEQLDEVRWRLPRVGAMRVEGRVYADQGLREALARDPCLEQVAAVATLPGIVGVSLGMPDLHWGYGFPIGGVAAFDPAQGGVVSPGGVGFDINCGVRLHTTALEAEAVLRAQGAIADALQRAIPAGVGVGREGYTDDALESFLALGAGALVDSGEVAPEDLNAIEDGGCLAGAAPALVSDRARERGRQQLGTLGSGNHFLELGRVDQVYDSAAAEAFGLALGGVTLLVHSGSRGLGHAVCEELLPTMLKTSKRHGITLPDKQLACAPLGTPEADRYLGAMAAAANFAYVNRALMAWRALRALGLAAGVGRNGHGGRLLYDVCHNIAKLEEHQVDGVVKRLCVHRKGATRALGPGHPALSEALRPWGQPVLIPGDMGRYSYVLRGAPGALAETFGSACHGAGRLLARGEARKRATGSGVLKALRDKGIALRAASVSAVVEEMPEAYKDVADVVGVVERAGLATRVARLTPLVVVKG